MFDDVKAKKFRQRTKKYLKKWVAPCELRDGFVFVGEHRIFIDAKHFLDDYNESKTMWEYEQKCDLRIARTLLGNIHVAQDVDDCVQLRMEGFDVV